MAQRQQRPQRQDLKDFTSLNEDEIRVITKNFSVKELLPLREVNKKTRDIIDAELVHRHRVEFKGTREKPIGHIYQRPDPGSHRQKAPTGDSSTAQADNRVWTRLMARSGQ